VDESSSEYMLAKALVERKCGLAHCEPDEIKINEPGE